MKLQIINKKLNYKLIELLTLIIVPSLDMGNSVNSGWITFVKRYLPLLLNKISLILMCAYMTSLVYVYLGKNIWNARIPDIGSTKIARILMGTHFILALITMYGYLIQPHMKIIFKPCFKNYRLIHIIFGSFMYICAVITAVFGIIYGFVHGTIGGLVMDSALVIYGCTVILFVVFSSIYTVCKQKSKKFRLYHKCFYYIYGALMYGSVIYRLQYIFAALCGYMPPDNIHIDRYFRPLDRVFVFSFYLVPLLFVMIYNYARVYKYRVMKYWLYGIGTIVNMLLGGLALLGCLYHKT